MSDSDSDGADIPEREVCEKLCVEFAQITDTDTACAMFYLQDRQWNLETSINAYFEEKGILSSGAGDTGENKTEKKKEEDPEPHRIRIMSWNIDGLDANNIKNRTKGVCNTINKEKPDVVFLQEVVPVSLSLLEDGCPGYQVVPAGGEGYFIAMMLRITSVQFKDSAITPFHSSKMARNLLQIKATIKNVPFLLITTHLESTKSHEAERKRQLKKAFEEVKNAEADRTVVFGGDLNLRDNELAAIGGPPERVLDLWEVTGKRPEAKFTWDLSRNDNLEWNFPSRPKCRFDRLYMRPANKKTVKPVYFELIGLERLASCKRYCSDHWGILSHFDKI